MVKYRPPMQLSKFVFQRLNAEKPKVATMRMVNSSGHGRLSDHALSRWV